MHPHIKRKNESGYARLYLWVWIRETSYQTIRQIAKKLLLKGGKFVLGWRVGVSTLHARDRSPNLTMKTLILSVTHMI